jgi:hypothetical protein
MSLPPLKFALNCFSKYGAHAFMKFMAPRRVRGVGVRGAEGDYCEHVHPYGAIESNTRSEKRKKVAIFIN